MNKKLILIMFLLIVAGCNQPHDMAGAGELRRAFFKECMELASKANNGVNSTVESEVSELVDSCDSVAYYQANQVLKTR